MNTLRNYLRNTKPSEIIEHYRDMPCSVCGSNSHETFELYYNESIEMPKIIKIGICCIHKSIRTDGFVK